MVPESRELIDLTVIEPKYQVDRVEIYGSVNENFKYFM